MVIVLNIKFEHLWRMYQLHSASFSFSFWIENV